MYQPKVKIVSLFYEFVLILFMRSYVNSAHEDGITEENGFTPRGYLKYNCSDLNSHQQSFIIYCKNISGFDLTIIR